MHEFLTLTKNGCSDPFREQYFFQIESKSEREEFMKEIRTKFNNISRVLDCVGCEKCRLNGKVQIKGLRTAMKVLFNESGFKLARCEIVVSRYSLLNM